MNEASVVLRCEQLCKMYHDADRELPVLVDIDFAVGEGETAAILGASGSGKSTLLHLLGGLDHPTMGQVFWSDQNIAKLSEKKRCRLRNRTIGFVYQFHHLLPEFTALENVAMPLLIQGTARRRAKGRAEHFLQKVGLQDRASHKSGELSGGERQRVAIARALVTEPVCVLADEPTGNLDAKTAADVLDVMLALQKDLATSFVIVTHNAALVERLDRYYHLQAGQLTE